MALQKRKSASVCPKFMCGEDGTVTVEAVLWLPVFLGFFALLIDLTMVMFG